MNRRREVIPIAENKKSGDLQKDNVKGQSHITKIVIISLLVLLLAAIVVIVWLINKNNEKPVSEAQGSIQKTESVQSEDEGLVVPERPEMIDVTAYEKLKLKADTKDQSVRFENPLQNNCWMVITLSLEDGTELWKSDELQPGQVVRSITLNQTLAAGEYKNAVIKYQHWTYDDEKLPLNGAETLITLTVGQ